MPPSPLDHSGEVDAPAGVPRAGEPGSAAGRPARRWLVDGMNVVGCEPDGWWRDRPRAMADLAGELAGFGRDLGEEVTVVFDGHPPPGLGGGGLEVVGAPGGPDAADDEIVARVRADPAPAELVVVTSDAGLRTRLRGTGVTVIGSRGFRRRLLPAAGRPGLSPPGLSRGGRRAGPGGGGCRG